VKVTSPVAGSKLEAHWSLELPKLTFGPAWVDELWVVGIFPAFPPLARFAAQLVIEAKGLRRAVP
jgi:hypothetical protein